ncbi:KilA-N domain-containing protein [Pasteurella oralis]|uniref:KilA-N domain-containing protein n=1 Tax=Pasteurella oralis TaxID=1071947 RepID=UPI000C7A7C4B|nr:KilA-N domain-containing protein [Pasteurella oralis]
MSNLTILNTSIRTIDNLFCLNDLHKASGSDKNKQPAFFIRNEQTKDLISEINSENSHSANSQTAIKSINGGKDRGTYACEELVLSYAMWISPKFHLVVLRAFLAMHRNEPQQLALPEPEKKYTFSFTEYELQQLAWAWFAFSRCTETLRKLYSPLQKLGSHFAVEAYGCGVDYHHLVQNSNDTINRITKEFKCVSHNNWRVLEHVRNFDKNAIVYNQIHD